MLRKALVYIRNQYNSNLRGFLLRFGGSFLLLAVLAVLVDSTLPYERWWNVLRAILLALLSCSLFAVGYAVSIYLHRARKRNDPTWTPYRLRFSLRMRRRMAAVGAAIVVVFMMALKFSPLYTLLSSCFVALLLALLAFIRTTREEQKRIELALPDSRDMAFDQKLREDRRRRETVKAEKQQARKSKRRGLRL